MKKIGILALLSVLASPCWAAWLLKNSKTGNSSSSSVSSIATASFTSALTNSSIIIVVCQALTPWSDGASTTTYAVPTDTAGNTYIDAQIGTTGFNSGGVTEEMFYTENTHTTASNIVTCHSNAGAITFFSVVAFEETGGAVSGPIDAKHYNSNQTSGSSGANSLSMTSQTTTINGDLIVAAFGCSGGPCSAGTSPNGFTQISAVGGQVETFVQTTAGAIAPTAGDSTSSDTWGGMWVAFTPSGTAALPVNNVRNDPCTSADSTSLGNNWTLAHCQAVTSDSLSFLTQQMTLTANPTVGDVIIWTNSFYPEASLHLTTMDSLGNVAGGYVTTTAPHTITFSSGIPFSVSGCSAESGGICDWNGKTIVVTGSGSLTINAVSSFTSLTVTNTVSTNATPVAYTGPTPFCTDVGDGAGISMSTCIANVTVGGSDTITVTASIASANFDISTTSIEIRNSNTIKGLDVAACPVANCFESDVTSNASTGVASVALTLSSTGELVFMGGSPAHGPVGITAGWAGMVIGSTSGTLSNTYCTGTSPWCINDIQSAMKSTSSSGSFTASLTDATHNEAFTQQTFAFLPGAGSSGHCSSCDMSNLSIREPRPQLTYMGN